MKIQVEATDLRDDKQYTAIVEAWETLDTVRAIVSMWRELIYFILLLIN